MERWKGKIKKRKTKIEGGRGGGWRVADAVSVPRLLSLLDACVRAGGVEEFQGSGSSGWWTVKSWGADRPLTPDTRHGDRRCDGVAVQQPELQEEQTGHLTRAGCHAGGGLTLHHVKSVCPLMHTGVRVIRWDDNMLLMTLLFCLGSLNKHCFITRILRDFS